MKNLVFLLEEPSARDLIEGLAGWLIPANVVVTYLIFEGKQDLEQQLVRKIRCWQKPNSVFAILRDQDAGDCATVKKRLRSLADQTHCEDILIRVACRELESWVLGDWPAVAKAFNIPKLANLKAKSRYRDPDQLVKPINELRKFIPDYQKRDGARRVGRLLRQETTQSTSFSSFCKGVSKLID